MSIEIAGMPVVENYREDIWRQPIYRRKCSLVLITQ